MWSKTGKQLLAAAAAIAAIGLSWAFLWPVQFGGQASWLVVEGSQLEPFSSDGDLVIARVLDAYPEGTLVAVSGAAGPELALVDAGTQGILGAPWLQVAGLGAALVAATAVLLSWPAILAAALVVGVAASRRRRPRRPAPADADRIPVREDHVLAS